MRSDALLHDVAWATARHIVELFENLLREEERPEAFAEAYIRVRGGLLCYERLLDRPARRRPSEI